MRQEGGRGYGHREEGGRICVGGAILHSGFKKKRGGGGIRDNKRLSVFISPASLVSGPPLQSHLRASECVCVCV